MSDYPGLGRVVHFFKAELAGGAQRLAARQREDLSRKCRVYLGRFDHDVSADVAQEPANRLDVSLVQLRLVYLLVDDVDGGETHAEGEQLAQRLVRKVHRVLVKSDVEGSRGPLVPRLQDS